MSNIDNIINRVSRDIKGLSSLDTSKEEKEEVPFSVLGIDLSGSDTAPPPIVSTDVTEEEADQLLAPYLSPSKEVGGSLKVVDPRAPDPRLQGWESMVLGDQDLSKEEVDEYTESISEEFEIPDYKYTMDQFKDSPEANKLGKKIYERAIKKEKEKKEYFSKIPNWQTGENLELFKSGKLPKKPKGMSIIPSAFQLPSDITGDITKPEDQSYGEWLAKYMSKSGYDFASQILTVVDINDMSKAEKMDQAKALDMWINTSPSISSTGRAAWHTISDPVNALLLVGAGIISKVAPRLAGKLGISAASALEAELTQLGVTKKLAKKLVSGKRVSNKEAKTLENLTVPKKLSSGRVVDVYLDAGRVAEMGRKAKLDVAGSRLKLAPFAGTTWTTIGDYIEQEKEIAAGVPDYGKLDGDKIEKAFLDYYFPNENKLLGQPENKGLSTYELMDKLRNEHYQKQIFLPENVKTDIDAGRLGQAAIMGTGLGTLLGVGGYTLGRGMRKFSDSRAIKKGTYREGYKTTPEVESALVGKLDDNNQPVFTNTYEPLPDLQDKHIIGTHIKKGTSSEDIFNEAVNINNILLPQTKDRDGGIVQVSVDRGTSKRELQDIKNKFRLANIDLREVTPEPRKPVGKPVSKRVEDRVVRKLAEGKSLTKSEQKLVERIQEQAEIREANRQIKEDGPLQFEGVKVNDVKLSVTGRPLSSASPVHVRSKDVVETDSATGQPMITKRNAVTEFVADINTLLGRGFKSSGAMGPELADITKRRDWSRKETALEIKAAIKNLKRARKKEGMSNEDLSFAINEDILNVGTIKGENYFVPASVQREINNLKRVIQRNENEINDLLGLTGEDRIGLGMSGNRVYITRNYEANFNPKYHKQIEKVLGDPNNRGKYYQRVHNARQYFKNLMEREEGESAQDFANRVDGVISSYVARVAREDVPWFQNIWDGRVSKQLGEYATKVLKERKNLDLPILDLLGEVKNPYRRIASTLKNQNDLIAQIKFFKEIEEYALKNLDEVIDLEGLFPKLPVTKTAFSKEPKSGAVTYNLDALVKEGLGKFGSRPIKGTEDTESLILKDMFTTPYMANLIRQGTRINLPFSSSRVMGRLAAFGQAGETILDIPSAYMLNAQGAIQALAMNGYLIGINPKLGAKNIKNLFSGVHLLMKQVKAGDPVAVKELSDLKAQGIIESDVVGENIIQNVELPPVGVRGIGDNSGEIPLGLFERGRGSMASTLGDAYDRGMKTFGGAYAVPDSWSKIVAHRIERDILKDIYTVKDDDGSTRLLIPEDELFKMASRTVRKVMPSYNDAWPIAKALGRFPLGTFALFPSEIVRTGGNILIKVPFDDIMKGRSIKKNQTYGKHSNKIGNKLYAKGITRTAFGIGVMLGLDEYIDSNNEANNITEYDERGLDLLAPDWGKGARRYFIRPIEEVADGRIIGSYLASTQFDAYDTMKLPYRQTLGKWMAGKDVTDIEMKELVDGLYAASIAPYTSPKFLWEAIMNIVANQDLETGRPIHSKVPLEPDMDRFWTEVEEVMSNIMPGSTKIIDRWKKMFASEQHRRKLAIEKDPDNKNPEDLGRTNYGFPLTIKDLAIWTLSGVRPNTFDLKKSIGFNLSKDIKGLGHSPKELLREISKLPDKAYTKETEQKIVDIYKDFQNRNYQATSDLADKARIFANMSYTNLKGKRVPLGIEGVLAAASRNFWYEIPPKLLIANLNRNVKDGIFRADNPIDLKNEITRIFMDKGWATQAESLLQALGRAYGERPVRELKGGSDQSYTYGNVDDQIKRIQQLLKSP
jgi:flagellar motor protein MotB